MIFKGVLKTVDRVFTTEGLVKVRTVQKKVTFTVTNPEQFTQNKSYKNNHVLVGNRSTIELFLDENSRFKVLKSNKFFRCR